MSEDKINPGAPGEPNPTKRHPRKPEDFLPKRRTGWIIVSIVMLVALGYAAVLFIGGRALEDLPGGRGIARLREGLRGLGEAEGPQVTADVPLLQDATPVPLSSPIEVLLSPRPTPQPSLSPVAVGARPDDPSIITFTIEYENTTGVRLTGVRLTDPIPSGTTYRTGSATPEASFTGDSLIWEIGRLDPGQSGRVSFQVVTQRTGRITNRATMTSNEAPPGSIESSTNV